MVPIQRMAPLWRTPDDEQSLTIARWEAEVGRQGEFANDRSVEFHCVKAGFGWAAALEKAEGPFWARKSHSVSHGRKLIVFVRGIMSFQSRNPNSQ